MVNQDNETALDIVISLYDLHKSSLRQRLTFMALKSAGAKKSPRNAISIKLKSKPSDSNSTGKTEQDKDNKQEHEKSQQSETKQSNENSIKTAQEIFLKTIKRRELHQQSKEKETEKGLNRYRDRTEKVPDNNFPRYFMVKGSDVHTYKNIAETLILVSTLIITASVAACLAVPGEAEGKAHNLCHAMFQAFIIFITLSLFSSISSIIILFWTTLGLTKLATFSLDIVMPILGIALISLSLAFIAGLYTVISELSWLANVFLVMALIFVVVEILLYMLLFLPSTSTRKSLRYISYYFFLFLAWIAERSKTDQGVNPWS